MTIMTHTISEKIAKSIPPLPVAIKYIAKALNGQEIDVEELSKAIEIDPVCSVRLLGIANSAYYQANHNIVSVKDAVVRLGLNEVKKLLWPIALGAHFNAKKCPAFHIDQYWQTALSVANMARFIGDFSKDTFSDEVLSATYIAGLIHNIGLVALVHIYPDEMEAAFTAARDTGSLTDVIEEKLELDVGEVGGLILEHWELPEMICNVPRVNDENDEQLSDIISYTIQWQAVEFFNEGMPQGLIELGVTEEQLEKSKTAFLQELPNIEKLASMMVYY